MRVLILVVTVFLLCLNCVHGQILVPDAPLKNFRFPRFGETGYKVWELSGLEGHYLSCGDVEIREMLLRLFDGRIQGRVETLIKSKEGIFSVKEGIAESESSVRVENPSYNLTGEGWKWDGKLKKLLVKHKVRVTFKNMEWGKLDL